MPIGGIMWEQKGRWFGALASDEGIIWLGWSERKEEIEKVIAKRSDIVIGAATRRNLERVRREVNEYFEGKRQRFTVPVAPRGTRFEKRVWEALTKIPYGKSTSYGELARQLGIAGGARAVGKAASKNPVPLLIPCHRLLASSKKLGGFSLGIEEKKKLLAHEGIEYKE